MISFQTELRCLWSWLIRVAVGAIFPALYVALVTVLWVLVSVLSALMRELWLSSACDTCMIFRLISILSVFTHFFLSLNSGQMALCQKAKIVKIYKTWSWSDATTWYLIRSAFSFHARRQVGETICKQNFTHWQKSINLRKKDIVECCYLTLTSRHALLLVKCCVTV